MPCTFTATTCKVTSLDRDFLCISSKKVTSCHPGQHLKSSYHLHTPLENYIISLADTIVSASKYHQYTSTTYTCSQISNTATMTTNPNLLFALESITATSVQASSIPTTVATPLGPHRTLARAEDPRHGCINGIKISTCKTCAGHVLRR